MGDNIEDAKLKDYPSPAARAGWTELTERAQSRGILRADYGTTCLRLPGGRLLIDRTRNFSDEEFLRTHREYQKFGITDFWVISPSSLISAETLRQFKGSFLVMLYPDRKNSMFLIEGARHNLDGGLDFAMKGAADASTAIPVRPKVERLPDRTHRKSCRNVTQRSCALRAVRSPA